MASNWRQLTCANICFIQKFVVYSYKTEIIWDMDENNNVEF